MQASQPSRSTPVNRPRRKTHSAPCTDPSHCYRSYSFANARQARHCSGRYPVPPTPSAAAHASMSSFSHAGSLLTIRGPAFHGLLNAGLGRRGGCSGRTAGERRHSAQEPLQIDRTLRDSFEVILARETIEQTFGVGSIEIDVQRSYGAVSLEALPLAQVDR